MSNKYLSADYHFHHAKIIDYCNRPFQSVEEMNDVIIRKHNERVKSDDTVNFLGDFGFFASQNRAFRGEGQPFDSIEILDKMNGRFWTFVKGNHDKHSNKLKTNVESVILSQNKIRIQEIHDPQYAKIDYDLILCGHVHNNWKVRELRYCGQIRLIINVGVDVWDFYPVRLDELLSIYYKWKNQREKIAKWESASIINELNKKFKSTTLKREI